MTALGSGCRDSKNEGVARAAALPTPSTAPPAVASSGPDPGASAGTEPACEAPPEPPHPPEPRVYAKTRFVWVRPEPDAQKQWIGYLWTGGSVPLKSKTPRPGPGCASFYAIEPFGFVCVDGVRATLDGSDPVFRAVVRLTPHEGVPWPHHYGESRGLKRYRAAPPVKKSDGAPTQPASARDPDPRFARLPTVDPGELENLPPTIFEPREELTPRSTVAYSARTEIGGRPFLLSADFAWVPEDRVDPYPAVTFRGTRLNGKTQLPLAFFRKPDRPRYRLTADGASPAEKSFERLSFVALTGRSETREDQRYLEVEGGDWVREDDAVLPEPRTETPWGARVGAEDTTGKAPEGRATWIDVSIDGGWLLAYEGTRPVFATLISPGRGGAARPGEDPLSRSASPVGRFPINGKFLTATMVAPGEYIHSDVPHVQNITGPYSVHGAYWHDNWGNPQSGGCINLSPADATFLFDFTEPPLPEGWHAVRWLSWRGPATTVLLHR